MDRIYEGATQVTVWLGEPDSGSQSAMTALQNTNINFANEFRMWRLERNHGIDRYFGHGISAERSGESDSRVGAFEAGLIAQLLDRPYWGRVWIIQEVILARKLVITCGDDVVPWENVKMKLRSDGWFGLRSSEPGRALRVHEGTIVQEPDYLPDAEHALLNFMVEARRSSTWKANIYSLLYRFRRFNCSKPEDRVFAFLGLVTTEQKAGITVDYTSSVSQVYLHAARALLASHKHLLVLNCRREPHSYKSRYQDRHLYSIVDQGRFMDPNASVIDVVTGKRREGWLPLPIGWERAVDPAGITFKNHSVVPPSIQSTSPLEGSSPVASQGSRVFHTLPDGWRKDWDNLGRTNFKYQPNNSPTERHQRSGLSELPTWVSNWDSYSVRDPEPLPELDSSELHYYASGRKPQIHSMTISSADERTLNLKGVYFDEIQTLAAPWFPEPDALPISRKGVAVLEEWEQLAASMLHSRTYFESGGVENAFWRTQVADYPGALALPEEDKIYFNAWCDRTGAWTPTMSDIEQDQTQSTWKPKKTTEGLVMNEMAKCCGVTSKIEFEDPKNLLGLPRSLHKMMKDTKAALSETKKRYKEIRSRVYRACGNRAMFFTSKEYLGLAPWNARKGDIVCVFLGGCTPFLLRPVYGTGQFMFVGEAYVFGLMGGELFADDVGHDNLRDFEIV
jgi:hypothetical protein